MVYGELVQRVWTEAFERPPPQCDAERALLHHLQTIVDDNREKLAPEALCKRLKREIEAKVVYTSGVWGYFEAANIGKSLSPFMSMAVQLTVL